MRLKPKCNCAHCGKLYVQKDARALYCSPACKTAAYRKRKTVTDTLRHNHGTEPNYPTIWANRTVTVNVRNPKFTELEADWSRAANHVRQLKNELSRLKATQAELKEKPEPNDDEKYYYPAARWGGGALLIGVFGSMMIPKNYSSDPEEETPSLRFVWIMLFVLVAIAIGIAVANYGQSRKTERLTEIEERLKLLPDELAEAEQLSMTLEAQLDTVPETLEKEQIERFQTVAPVEETETAL